MEEEEKEEEVFRVRMYGFIPPFGMKSLGCGACCYKKGQLYPSDTG
jgi:hypothetical protein